MAPAIEHGDLRHRARGKARRERTLARLLERVRPHQERRLTEREGRVEAAAAAAFLLAAAGLLVLLPSPRPFPALLALTLTVAYGLASRVRLFLGGGSAVPTQLVLVPMLFWLPVAGVPLMVAAGLVGAAVVDVLRRRAHPERAVTAVADAWYAVGPSLVLGLAGSPRADAVSWGVVALALLAQGVADVLASTAREWAGRAIPPGLQVRVILAVFAIDACLTPLAVLTIAAGAARPVALLALLPLVGLLAAFATDRRARIAEAVARLDELQEERKRLDLAIRRIGEVCASRLERGPLLELALRTAVEAVGAARGRATAGTTSIESGSESASPVESGGDDVGCELSSALAAAEHSALASGGLGVATSGSAFAMAQAVPAADSDAADRDAVAVARRQRAFCEDEQALFGYLAGQLAVAMENVALHERISREATTDELTGLANHRRFQETLRREIEHSRRTSRPVALVMLDIDAFKAVNDRYGHPQGDAVLRHVAAAVSASCRAGDTAARYGGEELAVIAADTDVDGAWTLGERIRTAVEAVEVPLAAGTALRVTVSVGVAALGPGASGVEPLVAAADAALYVAKRRGKNRTVRGRVTDGAPAESRSGHAEPAGRRFSNGGTRTHGGAPACARGGPHQPVRTPAGPWTHRFAPDGTPLPPP